MNKNIKLTVFSLVVIQLMVYVASNLHSHSLLYSRAAMKHFGQLMVRCIVQDRQVMLKRN